MVKQTSPLTRFRASVKNDAASHAEAPTTSRARNVKPIALTLPHGAALYSTGLELPPDLALDAWTAIGMQLAKIEGGVQWGIADWWCFGFHRYGERKAVVTVKGLPYDFGTLMNLGSVARRVGTSCRNELLTFTHHTVVAPLKPEEQKMWLNRAAKGRWTVRELRRNIYQREVDDLDDSPDERARRHHEYFMMHAQRAQNVDPFRVGLGLWNEPWIDHLDEAQIMELIEAGSAATIIWAGMTKGLKQYLED
jgi:hypothetical protein